MFDHRTNVMYHLDRRMQYTFVTTDTGTATITTTTAMTKWKNNNSYENNNTVINRTTQYQLQQQDVENHFARTADLIDNLTNSYKEVFDHLSESAEHLLTE